MESNEKEYLGNSFVKNTFTISLLRVVARIIGFVRQIVIANIFGASSLTDAYFVAYQFQAVVGLLLGLGPFQSIVTTSIINDRKERGDRSSSLLLGKIISNQVIVGVLSLMILFIFTQRWVGLVAPGFDSHTAEVLMKLSYLILLGTLFLSLMSIASSALHSIRIFAIPEFSYTLNSLLVLICLLLFYKFTSIYSLGLGHFFGGILSFVIILYFLYKYNLIIPAKPDFKSPKIREVYILYLSVGAFTLFNQIFVLAERHFASYLEPGKVTAISLAHMLVGSVLYTVISPMLLVMHTELSLAFASSVKEFGKTFAKFLNIILYIMLPLSLLLFLLAKYLVSFLFYHGKFDLHAVVSTSIALKVFAVGLVFQGTYLYLLRVITAMRSIKIYTPRAVALWIFSIFLIWYLFMSYEYMGILLSFVISFAMHTILLFAIIYSRLRLVRAHIFIPILKIIVISSVSFLASFVSLRSQLLLFSSISPTLRNFLILVCTAFVFLSLYLLGSAIFKLEYPRYLVSFFRRKH